MKKNWPVILVILLLGISLWKNLDMNDQVESLESVVTEQNSQIEREKLKNGDVITQKDRAIADRKTLEDSYKWLEDSLNEMGIKNKELRSALFLAQSTKGSGEGKIDTVLREVHDTTLVEGSIGVQERFFNLDLTLYPSGEFIYGYSVYDSLSIVNTTSRKNIFSDWEYKVKVNTANPNTTITGLTSLTIKQKKTKWVVGPVIGYGVGKDGFSPYLGIGLMKPVLKF